MRVAAAILIAIIGIDATGLMLAQAPPTILLRIDFPNGQSRDLPVRDGDGGSYQFLDGGTFHTFYFRLGLEDVSSGRVRVTIRADAVRNSDVLDELGLTVGDPPVQANTTPSVGMAVVRIDP